MVAIVFVLGEYNTLVFIFLGECDHFGTVAFFFFLSVRDWIVVDETF